MPTAKSLGNRRWAMANRDKYLAHKRVENALKNGHLVRRFCERCGAEKAQAHHDDYSKPFEVLWLCPAHHKERHRELATIGGPVRAIGLQIPGHPRIGGYAKGEQNGGAKITEKTVIEILNSPLKMTSAARAFGLSKASIWNIRHGVTWRHVFEVWCTNNSFTVPSLPPG